MNEDMDNKGYQIMELKQKISYYEPYKQKYEDLKEDWKYIKSLLDKEFNERTRLKKENEQLRNENKQLNGRNDELEDELEESSAFIIEQRKENGQLHYQIIELQDKLGMSEKQHDLKQIIELQNENIISKKKIKDLQVSLFLQSKELERQKKK